MRSTLRLAAFSTLGVFAASTGAAAQTLTANWDAFVEGASGATMTDGAITVSNFESAVPYPHTDEFHIDRADGTLAGMPGFTPENVLGFSALVPGAPVGFGRVQSFEVHWAGGYASAAQVEVYEFANYVGNTVTLEAISGGNVVASSSFTFLAGFIVRHHTLSVNSVAFDSLRVEGGGAQDLGVFFAVVDSIQVTITPPPPGANECFGDDAVVSCPCNNESALGANVGCLNSLGLGGSLRSSGMSSLSADTAVLSGTQMPNSSALYFQGTDAVAGGFGAAFGDGLRCVGGAIVRLGTQANSAGGSQYPAAGDLPISLRGAVAQPGVRHYQVWYRNAASYCTASTFNLTNAHRLTWVP